MYIYKFEKSLEKVSIVAGIFEVIAVEEQSEYLKIIFKMFFFGYSQFEWSGIRFEVIFYR